MGLGARLHVLLFGVNAEPEFAQRAELIPDGCQGLGDRDDTKLYEYTKITQARLRNW